MTQQRYPKFTVENFGPIHSGSVEIKPLTILIGANNSGKSYLATLAYSLFQWLSVPGGPTPDLLQRFILLQVLGQGEPLAALQSAFGQGLENLTPQVSKEIAFEVLDAE